MISIFGVMQMCGFLNCKICKLWHSTVRITATAANTIPIKRQHRMLFIVVISHSFINDIGINKTSYLLSPNINSCLLPNFQRFTQDVCVSSLSIDVQHFIGRAIEGAKDETERNEKHKPFSGNYAQFSILQFTCKTMLAASIHHGAYFFSSATEHFDVNQDIRDYY